MALPASRPCGPPAAAGAGRTNAPVRKAAPGAAAAPSLKPARSPLRGAAVLSVLLAGGLLWLAVAGGLCALVVGALHRRNAAPPPAAAAALGESGPSLQAEDSTLP